MIERKKEKDLITTWTNFLVLIRSVGTVNNSITGFVVRYTTNFIFCGSVVRILSISVVDIISYTFELVFTAWIAFL